jgi:uncharacterized membrane protein YdjX (TVP38/TMEM64 family)
VSDNKRSSWTKAPVSRLILVLLFVIVLAAGYFALAGSELMNMFTDIDVLISKVRNLGIYGPLLLIGLIALAIVFNPLPSAPIALGAGAVYGHTLGTVYVVAGAELGAILAFMIARWAGYDLTRRFFGESGSLKGISSQNTLTTLVFVSRLIPFMSFDLVSYTAGLSPIKPWRFAVATLLGLLPVSFALAHFGAEIGNGDYRTLVGIVLVIGLLTIVPVLIKFYRHQRSQTESEKSK